MAARLSTSIREGDTLARLSGDEFAILLDQPDDVLEIETVLRRMIGEVDWEFDLGGRKQTARASIGYTIACDGRDAEVQLRRADQAMYRASGAGRTGSAATWRRRTTRLDRNDATLVDHTPTGVDPTPAGHRT